jgi:hypothetical protein
VVGFFSARDVPGSNLIGPVVADEEVFASEFVTCVGQVGEPNEWLINSITVVYMGVKSEEFLAQELASPVVARWVRFTDDSLMSGAFPMSVSWPHSLYHLCWPGRQES